MSQQDDAFAITKFPLQVLRWHRRFALYKSQRLLREPFHDVTYQVSLPLSLSILLDDIHVDAVLSFLLIWWRSHPAMNGPITMCRVHLHTATSCSIDPPRHCIDPTDAIELANSTRSRLNRPSCGTRCSQRPKHVAFTHVEREDLPFAVVIRPK